MATTTTSAKPSVSPSSPSDESSVTTLPANSSEATSSSAPVDHDARLDLAGTIGRGENLLTNGASKPRPVSSANGSGGGQDDSGLHTVDAPSHPLDAYADIGLAADFLDDVEDLRKATENRLRALTDAKGVYFSDSEERWRAHLATVATLEKAAVGELQRAMRKHPLGPTIKGMVGVGDKQGARLLAAIGDPIWNAADDRQRRGPAELWAYCGYAPEQKRRKGVQCNWNATAKMRAHLIAESCIKQMHSPYRAKYDDARANWAGRDTSDGHKHNHALRVVAKEVLKDLYLAARAMNHSKPTGSARALQ